MKILVTGALGMLGREIVSEAIERKWQVYPKSHHDLDITDKVMVNQVVEKVHPDVIVNCAGIVKGRDVSDSIYTDVNAIAPCDIANICDAHGIKMVQISTDCVFEGKGLNVESDIPNARDIYGRSKRLGECSYGRHLTVRCSFVGIGCRGLLAWLWQQTGIIPGYAGVKWNGLTAPYAARGILDLIHYDAAGIVHIFGEDTTKYDLLCLANEIGQMGKNIEAVSSPVEDRRLRTERLYPTQMPPMAKQLTELLNESGRFWGVPEKTVIATIPAHEAF